MISWANFIKNEKIQTTFAFNFYTKISRKLSNMILFAYFTVRCVLTFGWMKWIMAWHNCSIATTAGETVDCKT